MKNKAQKQDGMGIRMALFLRGSSVSEWARYYGYERSYVWRVIHRSHQGKVASKIHRQLMSSLGL
jgi:hypothetical protein